MSLHAMTLRLPQDDYELLRKTAFAQRVSMTAVITAAIHDALTSSGNVDGGAFLPNPGLPPDGELQAVFSVGGGDTSTLNGLQAVWRLGCDAGMVSVLSELRGRGPVS